MKPRRFPPIIVPADMPEREIPGYVAAEVSKLVRRAKQEADERVIARILVFTIAFWLSLAALVAWLT